ncbi:hypothetical protein C8D92_110100 [Tamilnaduibacter salinus]|nr:hypothetical protein [Tamilnaduibacter salinus]PVY70069.1 hypothetical protein C8D92_110100 [Tamilnaduibacter salinus]
MTGMSQTTHMPAGLMSQIRARLAAWGHFSRRHREAVYQQRQWARQTRQLNRHLDERLIEDVLGSSRSSIQDSRTIVFYNALGPTTARL